MVIGMPRPLRIEYPGAIYHVMSRGNHRHPLKVRVNTENDSIAKNSLF